MEFDDILHRWCTEGDDVNVCYLSKDYTPAYRLLSGKREEFKGFLMKKFAAWWNPTGCTMYSNIGWHQRYVLPLFAEVYT